VVVAVGDENVAVFVRNILRVLQLSIPEGAEPVAEVK